MRLREIHEAEPWNAFINAPSFTQFTQSWEWGEFQKSQGHAVRRFWLENEEKRVLLAAQMIRHERRSFTGYWFAPRGPVLSEEARQNFRATMEAFLLGLEPFHLTHRTLFHRFEPCISLREGMGLLPLAMRRTYSMSPASLQRIHLFKSEAELLADMHEKTRYNMRVAEKHGVQVRTSIERRDLQAFLGLLAETAERHQFTPHARDYLRDMFTFLAVRDKARLRLAEREGVLTAGSMEVLVGDTVNYLHGASSTSQRQYMGPFLLHWQAMQEAKRAGYAWYDFGGCNPESKAGYYYKSSWEGITRFKRGWGGERVELLGTWDLPMNRWLYAMAFPKNVIR